MCENAPATTNAMTANIANPKIQCGPPIQGMLSHRFMASRNSANHAATRRRMKNRLAFTWTSPIECAAA